MSINFIFCTYLNVPSSCFTNLLPSSLTLPLWTPYVEIDAVPLDEFTEFIINEFSCSSTWYPIGASISFIVSIVPSFTNRFGISIVSSPFNTSVFNSINLPVGNTAFNLYFAPTNSSLSLLYLLKSIAKFAVCP